MPELEFFVIADSAYPWFANDLTRPSVGIDLPTANYQADFGQLTFERTLERAQLAERLGFDGVLIVEQHGSPIGLFGNSLIATAWLSGVTSQIKIAAVGPLITAYNTPIRLAEEIAAVDNISGGRLIVGLPLGIGAQYHAMGVVNPSTARARYREATDLMLKALDADEPFAWEGDHYNVPYVNLWPKPLQRPRPEVFIPAAGSRETLQMCARRHYVYQAVLVPRPTLLRNIEIFRAACREEGYEPDPSQLALVIAVHVAETDAQARRELEPHLLWRFQNIFRFPFDQSFPPGHVSMGSLRGMMAGGYRSRGNDPGSLDYDELLERGWLIAGSPASVRQQLADTVSELGAGRVIVVTADTMPSWLEQKWMTLLAEEVLPAFRPPGGRPTWDRRRTPAYRTRSEFAAREPEAARPRAMMNQQLVDVRTNWLDEDVTDLPLT
jgi:alkanesulfonate monooxygenase SsuD/methylene tetrahydromethanopterin reductase-like flavin-dependent oxidoreductase (luciferase family)